MAGERGAALAGIKAALRLHRDLGARERVEEAGGRIDVFGDVARLGAMLMFQPLDRLLGAYLPAADASEDPGVLVTTQRPLSVQRFTAAHELGHLRMGHSPSLDDEGILRRAPFSSVGMKGVDPQERQADAFASMYLVPSWMVSLHMRQQGWGRADFADPRVVYQASLRFGTSYAATCYLLEQHKAIGRAERARLVGIEPKDIKRALLPDGCEPPSWRGDVWVLTERDEGRLIEGGRDDLFVVRLREDSGAGYLWDFDRLAGAGFALLRDERERIGAADAIGGPVTRAVTASAPAGEIAEPGEVVLEERRPWLPRQPLAAYRLRYDLRGPERPGMWEPERRRLLQAA